MLYKQISFGLRYIVGEEDMEDIKAATSCSSRKRHPNSWCTDVARCTDVAGCTDVARHVASMPWGT